MFTGALGLHYGLERIGATVVPTSAGNTEKQLKFMRDFGTDTIVATPSYALFLAESAHESGFPMEDYKLTLGLLGSEGCTPEMRTQIEQRWGDGFFATDNYGMSELNGPGMSGECRERCGLHINEDHFLCEVIDAKTLEVLEPGATGELVVTNLTKRGIPMLRYRTKDITCIDYAPCACGRTTARMHKIIGRTDDMLKIRGVNVFPTQVESALIGVTEIGPHYQLVVRREGFADTLEVRVELVDGGLLEHYAELETLRRHIHDRIRAILGIEIKVSLVEPKSLERFTGKAKRVLDPARSESLKRPERPKDLWQKGQMDLKALLLGNEAVARGLYEAGVRVVSSYPGTPSTEITESVVQYKEDIYAEWAPNEKVALEVAHGACTGGARSFCAMKHVG